MLKDWILLDVYLYTFQWSFKHISLFIFLISWEYIEQVLDVIDIPTIYVHIIQIECQ